MLRSECGWTVGAPHQPSWANLPLVRSIPPSLCNGGLVQGESLLPFKGTSVWKEMGMTMRGQDYPEVLNVSGKSPSSFLNVLMEAHTYT